MKKLLIIIYWILQLIAFVMELEYLYMLGGFLGLALGFTVFPIAWVILPFYMFFASGIWLPLAITVFCYIILGIGTIIDKFPTDTYKYKEKSDKQLNAFALVGFVLGLLSILLFFPIGIIPILVILTTIFSSIALNQIKKYNHKGKGFAITGLILGIVFLLLLGVDIFLYMKDNAKEVAEEINSNNELRLEQESTGNISTNNQNEDINNTQPKNTTTETTQRKPNTSTTTTPQRKPNTSTTTTPSKTYCAGGKTVTCPGAFKCPGAPTCPGGKEANCPGETTKTCTEAHACIHGEYSSHDYNNGEEILTCSGGKMCSHGRTDAHDYTVNCPHGYSFAHQYTIYCEHQYSFEHRVGTCEHAFTIDHMQACEHYKYEKHTYIEKCEHGFEQPHYY